ncbi:hypothetical protein GOBAR_DD26511 [Gossypium barbadense]|nr:hypothetical protein GOBAR_DD26511 [Gossypium barbadense]
MAIVKFSNYPNLLLCHQCCPDPPFVSFISLPTLANIFGRGRYDNFVIYANFKVVLIDDSYNNFFRQEFNPMHKSQECTVELIMWDGSSSTS